MGSMTRARSLTFSPQCSSRAALVTLSRLIMTTFFVSSVAQTVYVDEPPADLGYVDSSECNTTSEFASLIGDFRQCSCSDTGCCFSTDPSWWLKWGACEGGCCIRALGPIALALCPIAAALLLLVGCSGFYCCFKGKCCGPFAWLNLRKNSRNGHKSDDKSGVMFVPNIMFDSGESNRDWQNSGNSTEPLNAHHQNSSSGDAESGGWSNMHTASS